MSPLYNKIFLYFRSLLLPLFLVSIVLFRLPNYYYLPLSSDLATTQVLARVFIALVFFILSTAYIVNNQNITKNKSTLLIMRLVICLFIVQSLSILEANNISSFLFRYFKDTLPAVMVLFVFYFFRSEYKKIAFFVVVPIIPNLIYQLLLTINPGFFLELASKFIYNRHFDFIMYDLNRGRIHIDTYDEAVIPLLLLTPLIKKPTNYILVLLLSFFAFISNFRTRVLMLGFAIFSSILSMKDRLRNLISLIIILLIVGVASSLLAYNLFGYSYFERLTLQDNLTDVTTIISRTEQIDDSIKIGSTSLLGTGLGNYYDVLNRPKDLLKNENVDEGGRGYVHNVLGSYLAESGVISLFIFLFLLYLFLKMDIETMKGQDQYRKAFTLCFWTIFIYAFLNPDVGGTYLVLFWGSRGLLLK